MNPTPHPVTRAAVACCALLAATLSAASLFNADAQSGTRPGAKTKSSQAAPTPAPTPPAPALRRTSSRQETRRFGYGGRVTVYGAPAGSLLIEAWAKNEVEITADIELSADTEEDLARLAAVNTFQLDEDVNHLRILTSGTHDRKYMKRAARDFPKRLLGLPWKIDYRVRVPAMTDLEIYAGRGPLTITDVEGAIRLNAGDSDPTSFTLAGGDVEATLQTGTVNVRVPARSWRGRGFSLRLLRGDLNLEIPAGFNGDVNAEVLRAGRVENSYAGLAPRERTKATERSLQGRAGAGGATLSLTVGDGTITIRQADGQP